MWNASVIWCWFDICHVWTEKKEYSIFLIKRILCEWQRKFRSMEKQEEISCKQHMNETWWLFQCYNMPRCKIVKLMAKTPKAVLISFGVFFLHCLGFVIYFFSLCVHSIQKENVCFLLQLKNACLRYKHCVLLTLFNEKNGTYI